MQCDRNPITASKFHDAIEDIEIAKDAPNEETRTGVLTFLALRRALDEARDEIPFHRPCPGMVTFSFLNTCVGANFVEELMEIDRMVTRLGVRIGEKLVAEAKKHSTSSTEDIAECEKTLAEIKEKQRRDMEAHVRVIVINASDNLTPEEVVEKMEGM